MQVVCIAGKEILLQGKPLLSLFNGSWVSQASVFEMYFKYYIDCILLEQQ
jgi:hypothetical protein